jgi:hypothetical protein
MIWKLTPKVQNVPDWEASTYCGEVIVRACDQWEARQLATIEFTSAAKAGRAQRTRVNPWNDSNLVACQPIKDCEFTEHGSPSVLAPAPPKKR